MKKILTLMLVLCGILALAACTGLPGSNPGGEHTHEVSQTWAFDTENHWHTCSGCDELLDKAAHSLGEWEVVTEATETAAGEKKRECECGYSETEAIAKLEHVHKYEWTTKTPATCTEAEVELGTCACGDTTTREGDAALGHSWDQGVVTTEPTEEAEGVKTYTCSACGETKTETIAKLEPTTPAETVTLYLLPNANWKEADARFAVYSWDTNGSDNWVNMTDEDSDGIYEATLELDTCSGGIIFCRMNPAALDNTWDNKWNQTSDLKYDGTNDLYTVEEGSWDSGNGVWSVKGEVHVHDYEWTTKTAATCTEAEVELGTCECGDTTTREGDAALGHTEGAAATCTTAQKCTVCDTELAPALGHSWDQGVVTTEPTEEAEGVKTYTCSACGETKTESIPKLGHTHVFAEELKYNDTKHWKECSCGEKSEEADHVYGEWTRVEGEYKEVQSCECGASNTRDITVYEVEVNDELVEVEELAKGSDNYACKVLVAKGDLVTIYVSGTALKVKDSTETIYVAESYGYYTFYVNTKNQVWPSFTEGVQFSAYKLYVNNVETDCAVTVAGTDYAQFEVELKVDDVVTIYGDEKELTAEGGYKVTVEGKHTFYVNNKNEVYPVAPSAPVDPDAPEPTGLTLYLKPNANWKADNARFAVYYWNASGDSWKSMTDSDGDGIYEVTIDPTSCTSGVIFCRMNPNNSTNSWNNKWNQTSDLKYDGINNMYTVKEGTWDKGGGTWSVK